MPEMLQLSDALLPSYHLLVAEPSKYRYSSTIAQFRTHLELIVSHRGESSSHPPAVTFDDAHASQSRLGLPLLQEYRVKGIFFAISSWTARKQGYMTWDDLRQLLAAGHEVQSHGVSHVQLTRCSDDELRSELANSKAEIEQRLGVGVDAISIPNGRWNDRVLQACAEAGYRRIYSSDPVATVPVFGSELIGRWMVTRKTTAKEMCGVLRCDPRALRITLAKHRSKLLVRAAVGEAIYDRVWGVLRSRKSLRQSSSLYPSLDDSQ